MTDVATYHLARLLAGVGDADADAIRATWPDAPIEDRGAFRAWLDTRPELARAVSDVDLDAPPPDSTPPLSLLSADDILTSEWPEPIWAIPDYLPAGLTILAGKPKLGKSWLALQASQAIAAGGITLGKRVEGGAVLYLALEDPPRRLKGRMQKQLWPSGLPAEFLALGEFAEKIGDLRNGGSEVLARQIEWKRYRLVVVDTLSRAISGDQSDVAEMTLALTPLQEIAHANNCAVLLVDHHRKGFLPSPDAVGDILGSTAKGAMADCIWGLYREPGKAGAVLTIVGRDVIERNLALKWDVLTGCWQVEGDADEIELTQRRAEILDALESLGKSQLQDIVSEVGQDRSNVYKRLQDLVNAGLVAKKKVSGRVYYNLPGDEESVKQAELPMD